jgi:hypothetical protein
MPAESREGWESDAFVVVNSAPGGVGLGLSLVDGLVDPDAVGEVGDGLGVVVGDGVPVGVGLGLAELRVGV